MVSSVFALFHLGFPQSGIGSSPPLGLLRREPYLIRQYFPAIALSVGVFCIPHCDHDAFRLPPFDVDALRFRPCDAFRFHENKLFQLEVSWWCGVGFFISRSAGCGVVGVVSRL